MFKIINNERGDSFTVLMTSLSIIMLAFFILLNSIAVIDEQRKRRALGSLLGAFRILPGGLVALKGKGKSLTLPGIPMVPAGGFFKSIMNRYEEKIIKDGLAADIGIINNERGVTFSLSNKILFKSGSSLIMPSGKNILKDIVKLFKRANNRIEVIGHTDSIPIKTKKYSSNWDLSIDRAVNALDFLLKEGISPARMSVGGYADTKPVFLNPKNAHKNRRLELTLLSEN